MNRGLKRPRYWATTKSKHLTGQKFGRLTAIWPVRKKLKSGKVKLYWICGCDCGNVKEIQPYLLRSGGTKSCGCLQKELKAKHARTLAKAKNSLKYMATRKKEAMSLEERRAAQRERNKNNAANLTDVYVKNRLTSGSSLKYSDIPNTLVEAKREQLKIRRELLK